MLKNYIAAKLRSLINTSIDNANFTANITADTVQITGNY